MRKTVFLLGMLLCLFQTALLGQNLTLSADSCYSPEDRRKLANIIILNDFLLEQDSLRTVIIEKNENKLAIADTLISKQKSIIFKQEEEITLNKDEIKRLNGIIGENKKEKLFNKIMSGTIGAGLLTVTGILLWMGITN
jgi:hypothetical protein